MRGEFTLCYHYFALRDERNHLELFLDIDGESLLETWRSFRKTPLGADGRLRFVAGEPHRRQYLNFAGAISNNRGRLRILRRGKFVDRRETNAQAEYIRVTL